MPGGDDQTIAADNHPTAGPAGGEMDADRRLKQMGQGLLNPFLHAAEVFGVDGMWCCRFRASDQSNGRRQHDHKPECDSINSHNLIRMTRQTTDQPIGDTPESF